MGPPRPDGSHQRSCARPVGDEDDALAHAARAGRARRDGAGDARLHPHERVGVHEHLDPAAAVVDAHPVLGEDDRADGEAMIGRGGDLRGRAEVEMPGAPRPLRIPHADDGIAVAVDALLEEREPATGGEGVVLQRLAVLDVDLQVDHPRAEGGEQRIARGDRRPARQAQAEAGRDEDDPRLRGPQREDRVEGEYERRRRDLHAPRVAPDAGI